MHEGNAVTENLWPRIFNLAKHSTTVVRLSFHLMYDSSTLKKMLEKNSRRSPRLPSQSPPAKTPLKDDPVEKENPPGSALQSGDTSTQSAPISNSQDGDKVPLEPSVLGFKPEAVDSPNVSSRTQASSQFCVFDWLNGAASDDGTVDTAQLRKDLSSVDRFLSRDTNLQDRMAYRKSPHATRNEVLTVLRGASNAMMDHPDNTDQNAAQNIRRRSPHRGKRSREELQKMSSVKREKMLETTVGIFNAAETIFGFFLPTTSDAPTVAQYWGSLGKIIKLAC